MSFEWRPEAPAAEAGLRPPPEWAPHRAVWSAWPYHRDWGLALAAAKHELAGLVRAIDDGGRGEQVHLLVRDEAARAEALEALEGVEVELHLTAYGDIWLRDTGPIFSRDAVGRVVPVCFGFNGWGEKYRMDGDLEVSGYVARSASEGFGYRRRMVLEGGAVDFDGEGTVLTTRQCLSNPNRNPDWSSAEVEGELLDALGADKVLWLQDGLLNDHTDGHVDTIARFVGPAKVVCMRPAPGDPNREQLEAIRRDLDGMTDARGRPLEVHTVPSPGSIEDVEGRLMPASYVNFYIANTTVVVPTYGSPQDAAAVAEIGRLFPDRRVVGRPARALLTGGGAFHCITQQQPAPRVDGGPT